jgi:hypothetical protein
VPRGRGRRCARAPVIDSGADDAGVSWRAVHYRRLPLGGIRLSRPNGGAPNRRRPFHQPVSSPHLPKSADPALRARLCAGPRLLDWLRRVTEEARGAG